jgi:putative transposase
VTPPRYIEEGQMVFVTMSAANRSFRFLPVPRVIEILWFLFAYFASKHGVQIHDFLYMSSHLHFVATDTKGVLPVFMGEHDSLLSRALNALRGIVGVNIEGYSVQELTDDGVVVQKSVYTLINPCEADLVQRASQWLGPNSLKLEYGQTVRFARPSFSLWGPKRPPKQEGKHRSKGRAKYRGRSKLPEFVEFTLVRPKVFLNLQDHQLRQMIRDQVGEREREIIEERRHTGRRASRMSEVRKRSYLDIASSSRVLFQRQPRVSGRDPERVAEALARHSKFIAQHDHASRCFRDGEHNVEFPHGTWLMRVRFHVRCAAGPP